MSRPRRQSELPGAAELYDRLLGEQGGHCALCPSTPKSRRLHIDHDHKTGRTRGLLCYRCNRWILTYNGSAEGLRAAADYLDGIARTDADPALREAYPTMTQLQREARSGVREYVKP